MCSCLINSLINDRQCYSTELANLFETKNVQLVLNLNLDAVKNTWQRNSLFWLRNAACICQAVQVLKSW
jgi:hypothetical protein